MYWWRIRGLRTALANGTLPERARFLYLLLFVVLSAGVMELPQISEPDRWDRIDAGIAIAFTFLGTCFLYRANGGGRGRGFLERYLSLSWVFGLRFIAVSIPLGALAYFCGERVGVVTEETGPFDVALWAAFQAAFYLGMRWQMLQVVAAEPTSPAEAEAPSGT